MNPETIIKQLHQEGFPHVYTWQDTAGVTYPQHAHKGSVCLFITSGSVIFTFPETNEQKTVSVGERFDVPVGVPHTAVVGSEGCGYIVGEMIEGDS
jgi:mannose-6-phosphate isomerase-like protein (cupin superfamily)